MRICHPKPPAMLIALGFISIHAWAQEGPEGTKSYAYGSYQLMPFNYPDILREADIREIVTLVEEATNEEIVFVTSSMSRDRVSVGTCEKSSISALTCSSGRVFIFKQDRSEWRLMDYPRASWQE